MGVEYAESKGLDHSILIFDLTLGDSFHIIGLPKAYILDWFFNLVLYMETHTAPYFVLRTSLTPGLVCCARVWDQ